MKDGTKTSDFVIVELISKKEEVKDEEAKSNTTNATDKERSGGESKE